MPIDLVVRTADPAAALPALSRALLAQGKGLAGSCGLFVDGNGLIHLLVQDAERARAALEADNLKPSEELSALLILAQTDASAVLRVSGAGSAGESFYTVRVPKGGSARVTTSIEPAGSSSQGSGSQDRSGPGGCARLLGDLLSGAIWSRRSG